MTCDHPQLPARQVTAEAERRRNAGEHLEVTRCEHCGFRVIVEPRTMADLEELAARIRARSGNAPGVRPAEPVE